MRTKVRGNETSRYRQQVPAVLGSANATCLFYKKQKSGNRMLIVEFRKILRLMLVL